MIAPGEAQVWLIRLDSPADDAALDTDERARAARFRSEEARRRYVASHAALRSVLARYTGTVAAALRFEQGQFGKPFLPGSPVRFSLAHSGERALCAVALETEIGVDIERVRETIDIVPLAARFLPAEDAAAVQAGPTSFFRRWTRREAYLKSLGVGLRGLSEPTPSSWFIADLDVEPGYAAALACERPLKVRMLDPAAPAP